MLLENVLLVNNQDKLEEVNKWEYATNVVLKAFVAIFVFGEFAR